MWRCPHCGTPQVEAARCWVCRRSSTSCATCRDFRHAVTGPSGFCGLDRRRAPLSGDEIRACWKAPIELVATAVSSTAGSIPANLRPMPEVANGNTANESRLGDLGVITLTDSAGRLWADSD